VTPVVGGAARERARLLGEELERRDPSLSVAARLKAVGGGLIVDGSFTHPPGTFSCAGYVIDVVVDGDTGEVEVADCLLVADVGTLINPVAARGQLIGGFATGLGQALMEEVMVEDGTVTNPNLDGYKIPTVRDLPPITVILVEDGTGPGPYGAKSIGELTNSAVAPAVANAIASGGGPRVTSLPITAEKVYEQLEMLRARRQRRV
jgi:CO/xanthine dehydrogenase Mo-binding subunit